MAERPHSSASDQLPCLQLQKLQAHIDDLYKGAFSHGVASNSDTDASATNGDVTGLTEEAFGRLGRTRPEVADMLNALVLTLLACC